MTVAVRKPMAASEVLSASVTGKTIDGMVAKAALSNEAKVTNTTIVKKMCPRPPHQLGCVLSCIGRIVAEPCRSPLQPKEVGPSIEGPTFVATAGVSSCYVEFIA